ncbi:MAG: hypothetical protein ACI89L_000787 [Phycisphaerales bacterium]|jgi:hypothetical protein
MSTDASPPSTPVTPTTVWCRPDQTDLVREVAAALGLAVTHAGCPTRGRATDVAGALDAQPLTDLRAAIASAERGLVWMLDPGPFGSADDDAAAILAAHRRGVRLASLEPIPASALQLTEPWTQSHHGVRAVDVIHLGPLLSRMPTLGEAMEHREAMGRIRSVGIESCGRPEQGSLGAHLTGSLEFLIALFETPELVDAAFVSARTENGLHEMAGETLRGLRGDMTLSMRFPSGQAATVLCSDHAGSWTRSITLLGEGGRMHVTDLGFDWFAPDGSVADHHRAEPRPEGPSGPRGGAVHAIVQDLASFLEPDQPGRVPIDPRPVLAAAQTALLSCRTGQAESPATITRLMMG